MAQGKAVGTDEAGNRYYTDGTRRWVVYNGVAEASAIPAAWHGWMHFRQDNPPGEYAAREWQKPHEPNLTGTGESLPPARLDPAGQADDAGRLRLRAVDAVTGGRGYARS